MFAATSSQAYPWGLGSWMSQLEITGWMQPVGDYELRWSDGPGVAHPVLLRENRPHRTKPALVEVWQAAAKQLNHAADPQLRRDFPQILLPRLPCVTLPKCPALRCDRRR